MKKISKQTWAKIVFIIIAAIVIIGIARQNRDHQEIRKYKGVTSGKVINFEHINMGNYVITYEYFVNHSRYEGSSGVDKFKCDNGRAGCVGEEFTVWYSTKNPEKSMIFLGKYEKHNRTVKF